MSQSENQSDNQSENPPCDNADCDRCHPAPRWRVSTTSVERRKHERRIKAATAEEALAVYRRGTAWPEEYDTSTLETLEQGEPVVVPETDERRLAYHRTRCCYHDLGTPSCSATRTVFAESDQLAGTSNTGDDQ